MSDRLIHTIAGINVTTEWADKLEAYATKKGMHVDALVRLRLDAMCEREDITVEGEAARRGFKMSTIQREMIHRAFPELNLPLIQEREATLAERVAIIEREEQLAATFFTRKAVLGTYNEIITLPGPVYRKYKERAVAKGMTPNQLITAILTKLVELGLDRVVSHNKKE